jgi:hypothetical protein
MSQRSYKIFPNAYISGRCLCCEHIIAGPVYLRSKIENETTLIEGGALALGMAHPFFVTLPESLEGPIPERPPFGVCR